MARDNGVTAAATLPQAVNLASQVVERRNTIPILSNLLLVADGKSLAVSGTDLDIEIVVAVASKLPAFSTTVDAYLFGKIVEAFCVTDDLHLDGSKLVVGKGPTFTLETLPADDYHHPTVAKPTATFELSAAQFLADLEALATAISTEETRYYLNGICFHIADGKLRMVATDGHRMHMIERDAPKDVLLSESILPRKCVKLLRAVLGALPAAKVKLSFGGMRASFAIGPVTIKSKLIDGSYPDYQRLIPKETTGSLTVGAAEIMECVEAASLILSGKTTAIALDFKAGVARAKEFGCAEMTAALPGKQSGQLPDTIGFNARYLKDICGKFAGGETTLAMTDSASPVLITGAGSPLTAILMPVRL